MSFYHFLVAIRVTLSKWFKMIFRNHYCINLLLFLLVLAMMTRARSATKPHIIFILADDLGFNDVSWHNPGVFMPNIDRLARDGVILEQSYVQPVCTPTRAALMTGKYPFTIGRQSGALKPLRPTGLDLKSKLLPQVMKEGGYNTHMVGKWHLGFCKWEYTPTYRGFDSFFGFYTGGQGYYSHQKSDRLASGKVRGYDFRNNTEVFHPPEDEYSALTYAKKAQEIITQHNTNSPLFMYLSFQSVHGPIDAPQEYIDLYEGVEGARRTYLGMVTSMDDAVGVVVDSLKRKGIFDETLIVFSTDNGGSLKAFGNNWPLAGHKSTLYEGGIRGPAFVHYPKLGERNGQIYRGLFHVVDWLPTLASIAGIPYHSTDGVNQWDSIEGTTDEPSRTRVVFNLKGKRGTLRASVRIDDYKLIIGEVKKKEWYPPVEGSNFKISNETLSQFKQNSLIRNSFKHAEISRNIYYDSIDSNTTVTGFDNENFDDEEDEDSNFEDASLLLGICTGKSKIECKKITEEVNLFNRVRTLKDFFEYDMELYNLLDDPTEEINVFTRDHPALEGLLLYLLEEIPRAVPEDSPTRSPLGDPNNFEGNYSPGWC